MNAKSVVMHEIGFLGGPKAQPPWAWGLGWALENGPKAHGGWALGLRSRPNVGLCGSLFVIHFGICCTLQSKKNYLTIAIKP